MNPILLIINNQVQHMELFFLLLLPLLIITFIFFREKPRSWSPPVLKPYPLLGTLPQFLKNRHRFLEWTTEILSQHPTRTVTLLTPGQPPMIVTANPRNVEHMVRTNFDNYLIGDRSVAILEDLLGHGIFNSDGEDWRWQRKAAILEFNTRSLRNFVVGSIQGEISERLLPLLSSAANAPGESSEHVDLQDVLQRFGFDTICRVAFGNDPACLGGGNEAANAFMRAFDDAQNLTGDRLFLDALNLWKIKKRLNIGSERRLKESISIIHDYTMGIIKSRKERSRSLEGKEVGGGGDDLISRFAANPDSTDEFLRDSVTSFILAGRETTSSALTMFFWLLSTRPEVKERIRAEVDSIRAAGERPTKEPFGFDELRKMHYLHAAISESLRLFPPVPFDRKLCEKDDVMPDGTSVAGGCSVAYSAWAMGRSEEIWGGDMEEFRPERWLDGEGLFRPESPFRFPVFHAGPRTCVGKEMAYIQMKSIAASVVESFEIDVVGGKAPELLLSLTLRIKGGFLVRVREREME